MIKELVFFCSIAGADYGSSRYILNRSGVELNPVLKSHTNQVLFHSGKCVAQTLIASRVKDPKKKKWIYVVGGVVGGGFVIHNFNQMRKFK